MMLMLDFLRIAVVIDGCYFFFFMFLFLVMFSSRYHFYPFMSHVCLFVSVMHFHSFSPFKLYPPAKLV